MNPPRVVISVECLTVAGLPARDGRRLGHAFETELSRLVRERGVPGGLRSAHESPALHLPAVPRGAKPESLGHALAGALYDMLDGALSRPDEVRR
jgi:hypothetical protein